MPPRARSATPASRTTAMATQRGSRTSPPRQDERRERAVRPGTSGCDASSSAATPITSRPRSADGYVTWRRDKRTGRLWQCDESVSDTSFRFTDYMLGTRSSFSLRSWVLRRSPACTGGARRARPTRSVRCRCGGGRLRSLGAWRTAGGGDVCARTDLRPRRPLPSSGGPRPLQLQAGGSLACGEAPLAPLDGGLGRGDPSLGAAVADTLRGQRLSRQRGLVGRADCRRRRRHGSHHRCRGICASVVPASNDGAQRGEGRERRQDDDRGRAPGTDSLEVLAQQVSVVRRSSRSRASWRSWAW